MMNTGIYVHIPFCKRKCNYCDFYSFGCQSETKMAEYVSALCAHIRMEGEKYKDREIDTVFIGGGTPSVLPPRLLRDIFSALNSSFKISESAEISVEANPGTLDMEKVKALKDGGVNRVSMGLQSVNESELNLLGRIHTLDDFKKSYELLRDGGIDNINIDIMYALPQQKTEDFIKTLEGVCDFAPQHISAYCLKIEEGTPFYKMGDSLMLPTDEAQYEMYMTLCATLEKAGYEQYEISNFAKKGFRCVHNLKYWLSHDYIGFGPSAHSYVDGVRYSYADSLDEYISSVKSDCEPVKIAENIHIPDKNEIMDEYVMLRLRLSDGVDTVEFEERFGIPFESRYATIKKYEKSGHVHKKGNRYALTPNGFFVSNYILSDILESI